MKKILSIIGIALMLTACTSGPRANMRQTGSGVVVAQDSMTSNDVIWYMFMYHMLFGGNGGTTNNYYKNPNASWTQTRYQDNATPAPTPPVSTKVESDYDASFYDTVAPMGNDEGMDLNDTSDYSNSFWDESPSYSNSFYDSTPSYTAPSYDYWDSTPSYSGGSSGGSGYSDSFFD